MELVALPEMEPAKQAEVRDELPLSGSGKLITTVEPKFIPKEAVEVSIGDDQKVRIRLIDCVGFLVKDASGHIEEGKERMVKRHGLKKQFRFMRQQRPEHVKLSKSMQQSDLWLRQMEASENSHEKTLPRQRHRR